VVATVLLNKKRSHARSLPVVETRSGEVVVRRSEAGTSELNLMTEPRPVFWFWINLGRP
jgi:hypothetical protein